MIRKDVTKPFTEARECIRDLWNQHYRHLTRVVDPFDVVDWFKIVRRQILMDFLRPRSADSIILVELHDSTDPRTVLKKQVEQPQVVKWISCESLEDIAGQDFSFVDFFDFAERELIDLRYIETVSQNEVANHFLFEFTCSRFSLIERK